MLSRLGTGTRALGVGTPGLSRPLGDWPPGSATVRSTTAPPPPITLQHMEARTWVVMPTYNEAANVEGILRATQAELARLIGSDHRILVVDDSSPDGTGDLAESVAAELETIEVMHRPIKSGLGHAYL